MASQNPVSEEEDLLEDDEQEELDDETLESDDEPVAAASKPEVTMDEFSIAARQKLREELNSQVEAFLARGGKINEIPSAFSAQPPKKPTPDYGGRPI